MVYIRGMPQTKPTRPYLFSSITIGTTATSPRHHRCWCEDNRQRARAFCPCTFFVSLVSCHLEREPQSLSRLFLSAHPHSLILTATFTIAPYHTPYNTLSSPSSPNSLWRAVLGPSRLCLLVQPVFAFTIHLLPLQTQLSQLHVPQAWETKPTTRIRSLLRRRLKTQSRRARRLLPVTPTLACKSTSSHFTALSALTASLPVST